MSTALKPDRRTIARRADARSVQCPACGAAPGAPCYDGFLGQPRAWEHAAREVARLDAVRGGA